MLLLNNTAHHLAHHKSTTMPRYRLSVILPGLALLLLAGIVHGAEMATNTLSANIGETDVHVLYRLQGSDCTISLEANVLWASLAVRAPEGCSITSANLQELLGSGLPKAAPQQPMGYSGIYLGRLLQYPWLVGALRASAAASPHWDATSGQARDGHNNALVAQLLSQHEALHGIRHSLGQAGYRLVAVSVEKVLVGSHSEQASFVTTQVQGRLPFDAQVWLKIEH